MIEVKQNTKKTKKPYVDEYYRFYVPVRIGTELYTVRLVAENQRKNNIFNIVQPSIYDVIIDKRRTSPKATNALVLGSSDNSITQSSEDINTEKITIEEMLKDVFDADGNVYYQSDIKEQFNPLGEKRLYQSANSNFKKFFGDSKVVDENGNPLKLSDGKDIYITDGYSNNGISRYSYKGSHRAPSYSAGRSDLLIRQ